MSQPEKIAVFGGGIAGLTAAFALSDSAVRDRYEITVYQMGWRLGGKGASGRRLDDHDRIEEHGLHIWLGCYENSFRLMRECYDECRVAGLTPNSPFQSVEDAFDPQHLITMMEPDASNETWHPWSITMPPTEKFPGRQTQCLSVVGAVRRLLKLLDGVEQDKRLALEHRSAQKLKQAIAKSEQLHETPSLNSREQYESVLREVESFHLDSKADWSKSNFLREDRRRRILVELATTLVKGVLKDVLLHGHTSFDVLDHCDFRSWLRQHGASADAYDSAPVRAAYEIVFSYHRGESERPSYAAGVATRFMLRWVLTYEGALIYKMKAGMGDTVFSPLYLALKQRGVKFKFFHRLGEMSLSSDKRSLEKIQVDRQVSLEVPEYDPLVWIKGIPCWPASPMYENNSVRQIPLAQQQAIEAMAAQYPGMEPLESAYSPWSPQETIELHRGQDFDRAVLAISLGALPIHCRELIDNSPALKQMVQLMPTVATQSFQLWMSEDRSGLGWNGPATILDSYLDSWADFSHLEAVENFPADSVKSIAYFSRSLPEPEAPPPPGIHPSYPVEKTEWVKSSRRDEFLGGTMGMKPIWRESYTPTGEFRWDFLVDTQTPAAMGKDHFDSQFWCANVNPTDRYIQSLAGTTQHRIGAGDAGFDNIVLAGDWIRTGLNVGCIESATNGGLMAARAICGQPAKISGEFDFCDSTTGCLHRLSAFFAPIIRWLQKACRFLCPPPPPHPPATSTPTYVRRGGDQSFSAPFEFKNVDAFAFHLSAPSIALQRLVDAHLNDPTNGRLSYWAPFSSLMLVFSHIAQSRPTLPPASEYGWLPEKNMAIWIPLIAMERTSSGIPWPRALLWYQPYIMVDQAWALTSGREVYGFPKALAEVNIPGYGTNETAFSVKTLAVQTPDPSVEVPRLELLRVHDPTNGVLLRGKEFRNSQALDLIDDMIPKVLTPPDNLRYEGKSMTFALDQLISFTDISSVFLKQFRDAGVGSQACYQSIVEADARPQFLGGSILSNRFEVHDDVAITHPFLTDFGWSTFPRNVSHAWHVKFDFTMQPGIERWRA